MNPDTVKTKADVKNVRKEYINNLRIQQSNIQLIENAIEAIDTTGDMILQPTDNRSTSQKNADIQQLKVDVRRQLLEIMDGENATKAVEDLARERSMFIVYLANTIEEVIAYFKPKYKNGVPAAVLVNYIKAQIRLRGVNERRTSQPFSQAAGGAGGGGDDDDDDDDDNNNSRRPGFRPSSGGNESSAMDTDSDDSDDSDDDNDGSNKKAKQNREEVVDEIQEPIMTGNVDNNGKVRDDIPFSAGSENIKTEKKPTNTKEKKVIGEKRGLVEEEEDRQIKRERQNEPERPQEQNKPSLRNIKKEKQNRRQKEKEAFDKNMKLRQMKKEQEREKEQAQKEREANDDDDIVRVPKRKSIRKLAGKEVKRQRRNDDPSQDTFSDDEDERRILTKKRKARKEAVGQDKKKKKSNNSYEPTVGEKRKLLELERKRKKKRTDDIENNVEEPAPARAPAAGGSPPSGAGGRCNAKTKAGTQCKRQAKYGSFCFQHKKASAQSDDDDDIDGNGMRKPKNAKQNIMFGTGLKLNETPQVYLPFGRYKINIQRLEQDTLMLRSKKGGAIPDIPTQKVKQNIISILKKIVNNDMPNYDDINKLNDDDKELLYKIIELSHLANKINVPRPCNIDKENQTFEIMKGEIIAGNDNPDIIKKFKLLLVKLMNNKRIPRRQGQEILTDLITLGY